MMGELMTAYSGVVSSDVFHNDRGDIVSGDVKVAAVRHPPYLDVIEKKIDMDLGDLAPPPDIVNDWVSEMVDRTPIPEAWEEIEYEKRYREFLASDGASSKISRLRRVNDHNDVVIVCGCGTEMSYYCPRRIIYEKITNEEYTLTERLIRLQDD